MQAAVSRQRESLADVCGVELTRYPPGLISALEKLRTTTTVVHSASRATAHLWIEQPMAADGAEGRMAGSTGCSTRIRRWRSGSPPSRSCDPPARRPHPHLRSPRRRSSWSSPPAQAAARSAPTSTTATTAASTTTVGPTLAPLTGLPTTDPAVATRPALVVKVDNADDIGGPGARPQLGLDQADVVYEEMVEGSVTRLAAVFQSQVPDLVGPVRSARAPPTSRVVEPLRRPLFAWSGGNAPTAARIHAAALRDVGVRRRVQARPPPEPGRARGAAQPVHGAAVALTLAPADAGPPPALFAYRAAGEAALATAPAIRSVHIAFGHGAGSAPVDGCGMPRATGSPAASTAPPTSTRPAPRWSRPTW